MNKEVNIPQQETGSSCSCCAPQSPVKREAAKIGRNDPCPCNSGRKFKKCCGVNA